MEQITASVLRHIGYLYLSFAHLSDGELLNEEYEEAKVRIKKYIPEDIDTDPERLMEEVLHWYNSTADSRLQVVNSIAVTFQFEIPDKSLKTSLLEDLVSIGKADQDFIENEKEFIRVLSKAWEIPFEV